MVKVETEIKSCVKDFQEFLFDLSVDISEFKGLLEANID